MHYKLLVYQHTEIDLIFEYLQANGFVIDKADDSNIVNKLEAKDYDACLLDGYTEADRYYLIRKARATSHNVAIIFLTKHLVEDDAINCFTAGADDYIRTPYDIRELVCRLNAVLKRSGKSSFGDDHRIGLYTFSPKSRILKLGTIEIKLTEKESKLLQLLSEYRNIILPRSVALKSIWYDDNVFNGRSMDVYVTKLRKHLAGDPSITITNVRSQGLVLVIE